jgi:N-acetylneuraminate synthase
MVDHIRYAELCMGHKADTLTESEKNFQNAMRSVVAKTPLKSGDILTIDNITTKRPYVEDAVPAINFFDVLGHPINGSIDEDSQLMKHNLKSYFEPKSI